MHRFWDVVDFKPVYFDGNLIDAQKRSIAKRWSASPNPPGEKRQNENQVCCFVLLFCFYTFLWAELELCIWQHSSLFFFFFFQYTIRFIALLIDKMLIAFSSLFLFLVFSFAFSFVLPGVAEGDRTIWRVNILMGFLALNRRATADSPIFMLHSHSRSIFISSRNCFCHLRCERFSRC